MSRTKKKYANGQPRTSPGPHTRKSGIKRYPGKTAAERLNKMIEEGRL